MLLCTLAPTMLAKARPRAAIVTGGTRGVGRGICEALAANGFDLLMTYNTDATLAEKAAAELRSEYGCSAEHIGGDISLESTRDAIFAHYDKTFAGSHALGAVVHNAGQYVGVTASNADGLAASNYGFGDGSMLDEHGRVQLDVMKYYQRLYGDAYVDLCERGVARMEEGGSLVGVSSPGATRQYNPNLGYDMPGSGKCVMEYAMRLFAVRCAGKDINCNVVVPGFTDSDAWGYLAKGRGMAKEEMLSGIAARLSPSGRPMQPRQLGDAVAFLCSPEGRLITGVSLPVDGGVHLKT